MVIAAPALVFGCGDSSAPAGGVASTGCSASGEPLPLVETFRRLRACRESRSHLAMEPYLAVDQRRQIVDLLAAMDELQATNAAAMNALRAACPGLALQSFDLAPLADTLGLFSARIDFVDALEQGDQGRINVRVGRGAGQEQLDFRKVANYWTYQPGPIPAELPVILRKLAKALDRIRMICEAGPMTPGQIDEEYRLRVGSLLKNLHALAAAEGQG